MRQVIALSRGELPPNMRGRAKAAWMPPPPLSRPAISRPGSKLLWLHRGGVCVCVCVHAHGQGTDMKQPVTFCLPGTLSH